MFIRHKSAIWRIKWADVRFGQIFATCGFDHKLKIWELLPNLKYEKLFDISVKSSANCLDWAPWGFGLRLACVTSSGELFLVWKDGSKWEEQKFSMVDDVINAVSWAPACNLQNFLYPNEHRVSKQLLATGGCDGTLYIWEIVKNDNGKLRRQQYYSKDL